MPQQPSDLGRAFQWGLGIPIGCAAFVFLSCAGVIGINSFFGSKAPTPTMPTTETILLNDDTKNEILALAYLRKITDQPEILHLEQERIASRTQFYTVLVVEYRSRKKGTVIPSRIMLAIKDGQVVLAREWQDELLRQANIQNLLESLE